mgnify:CR=1 FL=1
MSIEDSMVSFGFRVNVPSPEHIDIDEENVDDDSYTASVISQQILEYLAAKLTGMSSRVETTYSTNIIDSYNSAVENGMDLFITMKVKLMPKHQNSVALVQFFKERSLDSMNLASSLIYRLAKMKWFVEAKYKEEDAIVPADKSISSLVLAICLGNDLLCKYNTDPDNFMGKIVDSLLYTIADNYDSESK